MIERLKRWARELKAQLLTLWFCRSHPDTPLPAKIAAALVVAYAFSPIDLIPDFIPVIGYLDDLVIVPLGHLSGPASDSAACDRRIQAEGGLVDRRKEEQTQELLRRRDHPRGLGSAGVLGLDRGHRMNA